MVHCSGGGQTKALNFVEKLHIIKDNLFKVPPIFDLIQKESGTSPKEMYQVFNMGHRMELYVNPNIAEKIIEISKSFEIEAKVIEELRLVKQENYQFILTWEALNIKYNIFNNLKLYFVIFKVKMEEKFKQIRHRFKEISDLMIKPDIISDQKYIDPNKEYKELSRKIEKFDQFDLLNMNIKEAEDLIKHEEDKEMLEMARIQLDESKTKLDSLEQEIKFLLIPKDPEDSKNVVIEIRAGRGR